MSTPLRSTDVHLPPVPSADVLKPPSPPLSNAIAMHQATNHREPLSNIRQVGNERSLDNSVNTTVSAVNSSYRSSLANLSDSCLSTSSTSALNQTMQCDESFADTELANDITTMAENQDELQTVTLKLSNQIAVDRVVIASLNQQLEARADLTQQLQQENERLLRQVKEWETRAVNSENGLRQSQILLACMQTDSNLNGSSKVTSSAAAALRPQSPTTEAHEYEKRTITNQYRAAVEQRDLDLSSVRSERDAAVAALSTLQADYAAFKDAAAKQMYTEAMIAGEQREKFQTLMVHQLDQQRKISNDLTVKLAAAQAQLKNRK